MNSELFRDKSSVEDSIFMPKKSVSKMLRFKAMLARNILMICRSKVWVSMPRFFEFSDPKFIPILDHYGPYFAHTYSHYYFTGLQRLMIQVNLVLGWLLVKLWTTIHVWVEIIVCPTPVTLPVSSWRRCWRILPKKYHNPIILHFETQWLINIFNQQSHIGSFDKAHLRARENQIEAIEIYLYKHNAVYRTYMLIKIYKSYEKFLRNFKLDCPGVAKKVHRPWVFVTVILGWSVKFQFEIPEYLKWYLDHPE